jgi:hypothetical protein
MTLPVRRFQSDRRARSKVATGVSESHHLLVFTGASAGHDDRADFLACAIRGELDETLSRHARPSW